MTNKDNYKIGQNLIFQDSFVINKIYIDIGFLKNIDIGKLLSNPNLTKNAYDTIIGRVTDDEFISRKTNDGQYLFKDLPDIDELIQSNAADDIIFRISPSYDHAENIIIEHLNLSDKHRKHFKITTPMTISIDISILPNISDALLERLAQEYEMIFGVKILFIKNFKDQPIDKAKSFDIYYISDLSYFNDIMIKPLDQSEMLGKFIICQKVLPMSKIENNLDSTTIDQVFYNIELVMAAASVFTFVAPFPCLKGR